MITSLDVADVCSPASYQYHPARRNTQDYSVEQQLGWGPLSSRTVGIAILLYSNDIKTGC